MRLSLTVVLSSLLCYGIAVVHKGIAFDWSIFACLFLGGSFITFASNAFNQILEKEQDGVMKRTQNRPLVQNEISISQAFLIATLIGLLGFILLYFGTNPLAAVISLLSLILYSFVYTPSKKITPFCVLIGAVPGALPPLIGYLAATGEFDGIAIFLFIFQFIWQFPHFWAIAWSLHEDYESVGYKMLPSKSGKSKISAIIILIYTVVCLLIALAPYSAGILSLVDLVVITILGLYFIYRSIVLLKKLDNESAKKLMFASLLFMPIVYLMMLI